MENTTPTPVEQPAPTPTPAPAPHKPNLLLPISIIIAGAFIGVGVFAGLFFTRQTTPVINRPENKHLETNLKPISPEDHLKGSPSAPITLLEYSDTDCYFCNLFKPTVEKVMATYPDKVSWVYRHFNTGIPSHPHTEIEARATECVAELGGNDKFWQYIDLLFKSKDFDAQPAKLVDPSQLPTLAASIGVNKAQFSQCLNSNKYADKIAQMTADAKAAGGQGTPFSIIISKAILSKDAIKMVEETNKGYIQQNPSSPDVLYVSKDKHMIVLGGAMPEELMLPLMDLVVKSN